MTITRIAVLSTAHIHTRAFLDNIIKGTDGRLVYAIWDDVPDRGRRYATEYKTNYIPNLNKLLADTNVDGFLICAENTRHWPLLKKALPAGRPIFCEKPLTASVKDAQKVATLLKKHPVKLFCGYGQPFYGDMQAVAKMLADKALGSVTRVKCRISHHAAYGRWFDNPDLQWFSNPALSGGGAFMDLGTHALHLLRTLFGPVTEVWATIRNESGVYPATDDFGIAHLRFASGVLGTVESAWTQTGGIGGLEIVGSEKSLWHNGKDYVVGSPDNQPVTVTPAPGRPTTVDRLVAVIKGEIPDTELQADLDAILGSVAIMEAAYASSKTGRWMKVKTIS